MNDHAHSGPLLTESRRNRLRRRVQFIAALVVLYNLIEAGVAVAAGAAASSIALIGFGLDSVIEMSSALIILWQFHHSMPEERERNALRAIGIAFFALAAYVGVESSLDLLTGGASEFSVWGVAVASVSLVVMPLLSFTQRRLGRELGSHAVVADSKQTLLCTYMSAAVLGGLIVNGLTGWTWVDAVVGLFIAVLALREGRSAWRGESCSCVVSLRDNGQSAVVVHEDGCC